jgi:hypothetical protein
VREREPFDNHSGTLAPGGGEGRVRGPFDSLAPGGGEG